MRWKRLIPHRHRWRTMKVRVDEDMTFEGEEGGLEFIKPEMASEFNAMKFELQMCEFCEVTRNGEFNKAAEQLLKVMNIDLEEE